jgi:hypothetical protein
LNLKEVYPGFQTENLMIRNIFIGNNPKDNVFASRFRFGEVLLKNGMKLENLTVDSEIANNTIINQIAWGQEGNRKYSGEILTKAVLSELKIHPILILKLKVPFTNIYRRFTLANSSVYGNH